MKKLVMLGIVAGVIVAGTYFKCKSCNGTGWRGSFKCYVCNGTGRT